MCWNWLRLTIQKIKIIDRSHILFMNNSRNLFLIILIILGLASCSAQKKSVKEDKKKVVLIPGKDSHGVGDHEFLGGCTLLAKLLNENVPGVEAIVTEQGWPKDTTVLDNAATILMYSDGAEGHMVLPHMAHIDRLMKMGTGLMNLHFAVEIPKGEGGNNFLKWTGGYFEAFYSVNPTWTPKFKSLPKHPVTNGVKPFEIEDEWYYHMRFVENDPNLISILKVLPPASTLDRPDGRWSNNAFVREDVLTKKEPQTMAWAFTRTEGGRGFGFTGGHFHRNWMNDEFRKLVLNALAWTAKITVPENGIVTPAPTRAELTALQKKEK
jgi:type 1 glutamine amidotransferase